MKGSIKPNRAHPNSTKDRHFGRFEKEKEAPKTTPFKIKASGNVSSIILNNSPTHPSTSLQNISRVLLSFPFLQTLPHHLFQSKIFNMAAAQLTSSTCILPSFEGLKSSTPKVSSVIMSSPVRSSTLRFSRYLVVKSATTVAPKYTSLKPLGDRVLVKIKEAEEKTMGGILLPSTAQTKPQGGEVVAVGEGRTIGDKKVEIGVKTGTPVVYSKYAGTEVEFNGASHLILKEDDIVGILETDDVKDLKPLNDRVLIKVEEAEETTAGGLLLTPASKEKPSIGTVIAVGPGALNEEGNRTGVPLSPGNTVLYSKFAGNDFKGADGSEYITLRASDVMAVLS